MTGPRGERADLHLHTDASDGRFTGASLAAAAAKAGLRAIAVTDHDTTEGVNACVEAGKERGVEVVPGIELSCSRGPEGIHLVGLFVDVRCPGLLDALALRREARRRRVRRMVEALARVGVRIRAEDVFDVAGRGAAGRPHVAEAMRRQGYVGSAREAFQRFLGDDCPAYVPYEKLTMREGAGLIRSAGGVAVLAHPGLSGLKAWTPEYAESGLEGIEVYSPVHSPDDEAAFQGLADRESLLVSGGSDAHGDDGEGPRPGDRWVPYACLVRIKQRAAARAARIVG